MKDKLILMMDSGGGQYMHLSVALVCLLMRYNADAFVLDSYLTGPMCAADQKYHAEAEQLWKSVKKDWACKHGDLSIYQGLSLARSIFDTVLQKGIVVGSWSQMGFVPGQAIDRNRVLVERRDELFSGYEAANQQYGPRGSMTSRAAQSLEICRSARPKQMKCKRCKQPITSMMCTCPHPGCDHLNDEFSQKDYDIHRAGHRAGRVRNPEATEPKTQQEEDAGRRLGSLLKALRVASLLTSGKFVMRK